MINELEQIDWKVFPKYGRYTKGLRARYERMPEAEKLAWQQSWQETRLWRAKNIPRFLDHVPFFDQWYLQASISEVERWEWEGERNGNVGAWLRKITALLFGSNTVAWQVYYLIEDVIIGAQIKRDEARVAAMRKEQLKRLVG